MPSDSWANSCDIVDVIVVEDVVGRGGRGGDGGCGWLRLEVGGCMVRLYFLRKRVKPKSKSEAKIKIKISKKIKKQKYFSKEGRGTDVRRINEMSKMG